MGLIAREGNMSQSGQNESECPIKLFLVDDHLVMREALSEALGIKGKYEIIGQASDGSELLQQIPMMSADVIIMDLAMPTTGGIETIHELHRRGVHVPVLILSADESERSIRAALKAGARGFVPKQAGLTEMEFAISAVVHGQTYLSPSVTQKVVTGDSNSGHGSALVESLSQREKEIFVMLANGVPNREIGKQLHISTRTVDTHRSNILKKLSFKTNAELVKLAIAEGLVSV
jgi:two-component system response regulator NreC